MEKPGSWKKLRFDTSVDGVLQGGVVHFGNPALVCGAPDQRHSPQMANGSIWFYDFGST